MVAPYYEDGKITIYHGRCEDVIGLLPERPALVLSDPPYGARERTARFSVGRGHINDGRKGWPSRDFPAVEGDDRPFDPGPILDLKTKTILWGANYYADKLPPSRCWLVWDKREGTTPDDNADCELAWSNFDTPARLFAHLWRGVCRASEAGEEVLHPTQKPVALMRWCLDRARLRPGVLVFDPYMGSGPIAQACKEMGYHYIGCDVVERYCRIAAERVSTDFRPALVAPACTDYAGTLFEGL